MSSVSNILSSTYGIQTLNIPFQFFSAIQDPISNYTELCSQVKHLPISLIISNVGVLTSGFTSNSKEILDLLAIMYGQVFLSVNCYWTMGRARIGR